MYTAQKAKTLTEKLQAIAEEFLKRLWLKNNIIDQCIGDSYVIFELSNKNSLTTDTDLANQNLKLKPPTEDETNRKTATRSDYQILHTIYNFDSTNNDFDTCFKLLQKSNIYKKRLEHKPLSKSQEKSPNASDQNMAEHKIISLMLLLPFLANLQSELAKLKTLLTSNKAHKEEHFQYKLEKLALELKSFLDLEMKDLLLKDTHIELLQQQKNIGKQLLREINSYLYFSADLVKNIAKFLEVEFIENDNIEQVITKAQATSSYKLELISLVNDFLEGVISQKYFHHELQKYYDNHNAASFLSYIFKPWNIKKYQAMSNIEMSITNFQDIYQTQIKNKMQVDEASNEYLTEIEAALKNRMTHLCAQDKNLKSITSNNYFVTLPEEKVKGEVLEESLKAYRVSPNDDTKIKELARADLLFFHAQQKTVEELDLTSIDSETISRAVSPNPQPRILLS